MVAVGMGVSGLGARLAAAAEEVRPSYTALLIPDNTGAPPPHVPRPCPGGCRAANTPVSDTRCAGYSVHRGYGRVGPPVRCGAGTPGCA